METETNSSCSPQELPCDAMVQCYLRGKDACRRMKDCIVQTLNACGKHPKIRTTVSTQMELLGENNKQSPIPLYAMQGSMDTSLKLLLLMGGMGLVTVALCCRGYHK